MSKIDLLMRGFMSNPGPIKISYSSSITWLSEEGSSQRHGLYSCAGLQRQILQTFAALLP